MHAWALALKFILQLRQKLHRFFIFLWNIAFVWHLFTVLFLITSWKHFNFWISDHWEILMALTQSAWLKHLVAYLKWVFVAWLFLVFLKNDYWIFFRLVKDFNHSVSGASKWIFKLWMIKIDDCRVLSFLVFNRVTEHQVVQVQVRNILICKSKRSPTFQSRCLFFLVPRILW